MKNKIIIGAVFLAVAAYFTNPWWSSETVEVYVNKSEEKCNSFGTDCKYLIFADGETFQNTDTHYYFKYDSSDVYGKVEDKTLMKFKVYGFRIPFISNYRNIVKVID